MTSPNWAEKYLGLAFRDGGRRAPAVDCWGLVRLVYRLELGIALPSYGEVAASDLAVIAREMRRGAEGETWRRIERPEAFDLAAMGGRPGAGHPPRSIVHVGVMVDGDRVLHIERGAGASAPPLTHPAIRHRLLGFYRHGLR